MPHGDKPLTIERASREVIENQLLTGLDDKTRCNILATEDELTMLLRGLEALLGQTYNRNTKELRRYRADMWRLGQEC